MFSSAVFSKRGGPYVRCSVSAVVGTCGGQYVRCSVPVVFSKCGGQCSVSALDSKCGIQ